MPTQDAESVALWLARTDRFRAGDPRLDRRLSPGERQRASAFHRDHDRHDYAVAHAMLRTVLGRALDLAPALVPIPLSRTGRPELDPSLGTPIRFSLSHTRGLVVCGLCSHGDVGVDAERIAPEHPLPELVASLSRDEQRELERIPEPERRERFFELWTLKEAYVKARGLGLAIPFDRFTVRIAPSSQVSIVDSGWNDAGGWVLRCLTPDPGYRIGVAMRPSLELEQFEFGESDLD